MEVIGRHDRFDTVIIAMCPPFDRISPFGRNQRSAAEGKANCNPTVWSISICNAKNDLASYVGTW